MATVPISGTNIRFMSGIPFNNDYKNTRWFDNRTQQTSYFDSRNTVHSMGEQNSFQRIEGRYYVKVNKNIDDLWGTNYLTFLNRNKRFYAFVTTLEYINDGLTHVYFEIDVLQTWLFEMDFKPSYVIREHRPLWNSDGTPVINNIDEGLNYGYNYDVVSVQNWQPVDDIYFLVVVSKSAVHSSNLDGSDPYDNQPLATNNGMQQPLTYYIHPFKMSGGRHSQPIVSVDGSAYFGISSPLAFIQRLSEMTTTANNIVSMYVTDFVGLDVEVGTHGDRIAFDDSMEWAIIDDGRYTLTTLCVKDVFQYSTRSHNFGDKYSGYEDVDESKLLMHPYVTMTLTDFKGNITEIKPEYIEGKDLTVTVKGSMGTTNKVTYHVDNYLNDNLSDMNKLLSSLEHALINNNPNDIPVLTDMLSAYLQGNRNSLENQKNSIGFNALMNTIGSGLSGVASGMSKNPVGVAQAGVNAVQGMGNSILELQGMLAKMDDISNVPPQLNRMGSNTPFDYGNGYHGVYVIKKQIRKEYRKILGDFFKMFGYKTNEVKIPNFRTRQNWNYVQTESCMITGNFNNNDLQKLKSIFDNGITLWHTNDVGNYDLSNGVR